MAVKMLLSVSLLSWLLLFCSDCGLQGVEASPLSETFANRLNDLRSLYPKKTSIINETLFQEQKVDPRAIIQVIEIPYGGVDFPDRPGAIIDLSATYSGGWVVGSVYANIDWLGTLGNILLSGGPGQVFWEITIELPDGLIALGYDIVVTLFRVVNEKATGTGIPVEQVFRFDDAELRVKAPPEVRNEISYSKQQKKK